MNSLFKSQVFIPLRKQDGIGLCKKGFELALAFVFRKGKIFEQRLTRNVIKDGNGAVLFNLVKDQFGNVIARKFRRRFFDYRVMPRDLI